jgi:hypothetical protein
LGQSSKDAKEEEEEEEEEDEEEEEEKYMKKRQHLIRITVKECREVAYVTGYFSQRHESVLFPHLSLHIMHMSARERCMMWWRRWLWWWWL